MFVTAALAATEAVGEVAHEGGGAFPPFDTTYFASQVFWLILTFAAFYIFISRVALPRVGSVLETRSARIAKDLDEANALKTKADEALAAYEQSLASARANANDIGGKARDAAKAGAEATRTAIEAELAGKMADAEKRIDQVKASAITNLDAIAEDTAAAIVSRLFGDAFDKANITAAVKAARAG